MIPRDLQLQGENYPNIISSNARMEEEKEHSSKLAQDGEDTEYNNLRLDKNERKFIQTDYKDDEKHDMDFFQKDGISFTGDVLSFQEKEGSVDSWQDNDFTFFGSEPSPLYNSSPIMERIQVDLKQKDVEVIEVLSEYSQEKSSDPLEEGKSLSQLLAMDKRDTSAGKNNETESGSPIDELINFWNQNSSKATMLFQYEPLQVEANNKKENKATMKSDSVPKSDGLLCDVTKNRQLKNDKISKRKCYSEDKKKRSVFSRIYSKTATNTRKKSKYKDKTNNEYKKRLFQRSGKLMQYKISKKNFMEKLRDKQREKDKNAEILIEDPLNDESSYIMLGDRFGIMIECYSQESGFADIQEVLERKKDFAVDGKDSDCIDEIDHIIYPTKPRIRIGKNYQAILPKLTKKSSSQRALCKVWDAGRIETEQYEDYIDMLSELTEVMQSSMNEEKAVETLIYNNYSVDKALKYVRANLCYVSDYIESKGLSIK